MPGRAVQRGMHRLPRLRPLLGLALLLALASVAVIACDSKTTPPPSGPASGHPSTLSGTSWVVTAIGGVKTPPETQPTIAFNATRTSGSSGCNSFGGSYRYDPSTGVLQLDQLFMTQIACAEGARNQVEAAFTRSFVRSAVVSFAADGQLVLEGPAGTRLDLALVGPTVTD